MIKVLTCYNPLRVHDMNTLNFLWWRHVCMVWYKAAREITGETAVQMLLYSKTAFFQTSFYQV